MRSNRRLLGPAFSLLSLTTPPLYAQATAAAPPAETPASEQNAATPTAPAPVDPATVTPGTPEPATQPVGAAPVSAEVANSAAPVAAAPEEPKPAPPATLVDRLKIGGGGILWYYQPTVEGQKNNVEFYNVRLTFDADFGDGFGFHLEPRFRDSKLRSFYGGTAWIQEGYASYQAGTHTVKLGKVYSQLGLFWDNSFWGNVQVYDGLKLAPDYGLSLEGKFALAPSFDLAYAAQFFVVDGSTNVSLPARDTISIPDSRRRNEFVGRVDPTVSWGDGAARVGLSAAHLQADVPAIDDESVWRYAVDFKVTHAGLGAWGEYVHQSGQTVTDYPIAGVPASDGSEAVPGKASDDIDYFELGAEYTYSRLTVRYNFSAANYHGTSVKEWLHVPALGFKINDNLQLGAEYVHWSRSIDGAHERYNRSFNLLAYVSF